MRCLHRRSLVGHIPEATSADTKGTSSMMTSNEELIARVREAGNRRGPLRVGATEAQALRSRSPAPEGGNVNKQKEKTVDWTDYDPAIQRTIRTAFCKHGVFLGDANPNRPCPECVRLFREEEAR